MLGRRRTTWACGYLGKISLSNHLGGACQSRIDMMEVRETFAAVDTAPGANARRACDVPSSKKGLM